MFEYSRAAVGLIVDDLKKMIRVISTILSIGVYVYLVVALLLGFGYWQANACLIGIKVLYDIIELCTRSGSKNKKARKVAKKGYTYTRLIINGITIATTMVNMALNPTTISALAIISTTLLIVVWVLQVLFEVIAFIFEQKIRLLVAGFQRDIKTATAVISSIKNILHIGQSEPQEKIDYEEMYKKEYDRLDTVVVLPEKEEKPKSPLASAVNHLIKKVSSKGDSDRKAG